MSYVGFHKDNFQKYMETMIDNSELPFFFNTSV